MSDLVLAGILDRVDEEERRRGALVDAFGPQSHYQPVVGDGHDDYDCAAADRRTLVALLRETRDALEAVGECHGCIHYGWSDEAGLLDRLRVLDPAVPA